MTPLIHFVRWFNRHCPWNQLKPSLGKRVQGRLPRGPGRQVYDRIAGDLRMALDLSITEEQWMYLNMYDIATVRLLRRILRPGDVAIDAGANIGYFALLMARRVGPTGKVYAFEPHPTAIARQRENIALNDAAQITLIPKGVWHEPGQATMYGFDDVPVNESSLGRRDDRAVVERFDVELAAIDDIVAEPARLVKLDVEGAERHAIKGAARTLFDGPPPHVLVELNPGACRAFAYHAIAIVDDILSRRPAYHLHLVKTRRIVPTTRDELHHLLDDQPGKLLNVWFEPARVEASR